MFRRKAKTKFKPAKVGEYQIREVSIDDAKAFRKLYLQALKKEPTIFTDVYDNMKKLSDEEWSSIINNIHEGGRSLLVGIFDEDKLVGIIKIEGDEAYKMMHVADLEGMYILPKYHNKEIEKKIVEIVLKHMKQSAKIDKIRAAVVTTNRDTISLLNEVGFIRYGYDQGHYKIGKHLYDSILISKVL